MIRHDAVVWGYARKADAGGVHIHQGVEVTGLKIENGRCIGVETNRGPIARGHRHVGRRGLDVDGSPTWPASRCRSRTTRCRRS